MTQCPVFWHARHPIQKRISLFLSDIYSTSFPVSLAPSTKLFASNSELLLLLRLVDNTMTFFTHNILSFPIKIF